MRRTCIDVTIILTTTPWYQFLTANQFLLYFISTTSTRLSDKKYFSN